jgi:hypothetical protein
MDEKKGLREKKRKIRKEMTKFDTFVYDWGLGKKWMSNCWEEQKH